MTPPLLKTRREGCSNPFFGPKASLYAHTFHIYQLKSQVFLVLERFEDFEEQFVYQKMVNCVRQWEKVKFREGVNSELGNDLITGLS